MKKNFGEMTTRFFLPRWCRRESIIDVETAQKSTEPENGIVPEMLAAYGIDSRSSLLRFLLKMDYDELTLVTCDAWKRNCGGVPRNSFVIVRLNEKAAAFKPSNSRSFLILARIRETAMTPVAADIQSTIFSDPQGTSCH
ncbi:MAG: hypothetical protein ACE5IR_06905 [bacterium]